MAAGREPKVRKLASRLPGLPEELLLDELTGQLDRTRQLLMGSPEGAAERALERAGAGDGAEARIAAELAMTESLASPERFPEAHRLTMRALEVLDREGSRDPRVPRLGPLTPMARWAVEFVAEYIVQSYAEAVVGRLRSLYAGREVQCPPEAPERRLLARARMETERIAPGYGGGGHLGTILLVGGVAFPALASLTNFLGAVDLTNRAVVFPGFALVMLLFFALSSVLLRGAAVARRRSRLIMARPLAALWETVGHAGSPPEDDSLLFATLAIVLTALLWVVVPAAGITLYFAL
ncbi:MAG: hypothetical protein IT429_01860 [Gemmataceae bacterium]|nr:hypothetical protein [Gemmataceae bacterium]